ncbi:putative secondary metabolism biosynthetic enzyme [Trichoderma asperellum]|uniref:putative secondary metabolism biosynthetic enzyme n=1 Tax=Trichoderma asperellum TaxID=101201 RepID=UPI00332B75C6|nr:putative secondary metabolism biosynthetic enzyme [Trichoderma asperellum]
MIGASDICREDPIFRLGGDSLHVMRLSTTAHDEGLFLSTRDIFQTPQLAFLAQLMIPLRPGITEKDVYKPFCLLLNSIDVPSITRYVESVLSIDISDTNDLLSSDGFDTCTHWHKGDPLLVNCSFSKYVLLSDSRF